MSRLHFALEACEMGGKGRTWAREGRGMDGPRCGDVAGSNLGGIARGMARGGL